MSTTTPSKQKKTPLAWFPFQLVKVLIYIFSCHASASINHCKLKDVMQLNVHVKALKPVNVSRPPCSTHLHMAHCTTTVAKMHIAERTFIEWRNAIHIRLPFLLFFVFHQWIRKSIRKERIALELLAFHSLHWEYVSVDNCDIPSWTWMWCR